MLPKTKKIKMISVQQFYLMIWNDFPVILRVKMKNVWNVNFLWAQLFPFLLSRRKEEVASTSVKNQEEVDFLSVDVFPVIQ